ncbi:alpha/beta fold hydrolase [Paraburkholderia domus]|uniref:AB hydrolase-1 domain-containing protein n=1 Tax=Paraburkholderia domus TaxID=2793075 RepID=A0A9N8R6M0_9BURK|nr:alpha/beta fold hydrolase [Paraburkholderia domus]MBK5170007.1 alpha/beta hydrolase [Burkholderia sp. R-70211]CAE6968499.1 hypothetical protein R70211_07600 [Paraburkholderia domus]
MKVLIVDDSNKRVDLILKTLHASDEGKYLDISVCDSADAARRSLIAQYDLLILDVLIPKKRGGTAQALHSVNLLNDVCDPTTRFIRPGLIIGITADVEELGVYREQFAKQAAIVLEGTTADATWLKRLVEQVQSLLGSVKKINVQTKDRVVISVHGIRTYGHWQENLGKAVESYSRSCERIEIKFGFLNVFFFLVPFVRSFILKKVVQQLVNNLEKHQQKEILVVAHSFGTMAVFRALQSYTPPRKLKGTILCGSPLPSDTDIDHIVANSEVTYNECGTWDLVLVVARLLAWGLGDAGRTGFTRENSGSFRNRYFKGGHSLYFEKNSDQEYFYEVEWLKFLTFGTPLKPYDARKGYLGQDVVDLLLNVGAFVKPIYYVIPVLSAAVFVLYRLGSTL